MQVSGRKQCVLCIYAYMYIYTCVYMHIYVHVYLYICIFFVYMHICVYICVYMHIYTCVICIYIHVYICIYTKLFYNIYTYNHFKSLLNLLQCCFCFMFWVFGQEACRILVSNQGSNLCSLHWKVES